MAKEKGTGNLLDRFVAGGKPPERKGAQAQRPARAQAELPGTELSTMAEKQEGLLERVVATKAPYARSGELDMAQAEADLAALHGVLQGLSQKTVVVIFALGKILTSVKEGLPHGSFIPYIEAHCPFGRISAFRYMQVYARYRDEPRRALAELSISEAYLEAGVKRLAAPDPSEIEAPRGKLEYQIDTWKDWQSVFKKAPMSGAPLKHHRIVPYENGRLYAVREETGPIPVLELYVDMSNMQEDYQDAIQEAHHNLQIALEVFYAKVEDLEEKGILPKPMDTSRKAMAARMRNVTPGFEDEKAAKKGRKAGGAK